MPSILLMLWYVESLVGDKHGRLFIPPWAVFQSAAHLLRDGELLRATGTTLARYSVGTIAGVLIGVFAGVMLGLSRYTRLFFGPSFHTLKQVSLFAWVPLIMAWFGLGEPSKLVFIALAAFFPVMLGSLEGVGSVSRDLVELVATYEFTRLQLLRKVVLPSALPSIFGGMQLSLLYGWLATLGSEYLMTSGGGLGALLLDSQQELLMDRVLFLMMVMAVIGVTLSWGTGTLENWLLRWRGSQRKPAR